MKIINGIFYFAIAILLSATSAIAQETYPTKVVKLVVPFAPGGSTDLLARSVAERLGVLWKQSVIVENRGGAAGNIGAEYVTKQKADGYTLLMGTVSTNAVAKSLYPKLPYDPVRDFVPISELVTIAQVLSVHPSLPINSVAELISYAKSRPGELAFNGSIGTTPHMSMELLASRAGVKMLPIAYKGSSMAMNDLVAGQLQTSFDVLMTTLPYLKGNKLRALAVTSSRRSPLLPDVPTIAESGFPGYESDVWFGFFAPTGTPVAIVNKISADVKSVLTDPAMKQRLEAAGFTIVGSSPAEFSARIKSDVQKWQKVIVDAKISTE
jgi:tripartite-type tricarboxylate transporter receptor subunit TctC